MKTSGIKDDNPQMCSDLSRRINRGINSDKEGQVGLLCADIVFRSVSLLYSEMELKLLLANWVIINLLIQTILLLKCCRIAALQSGSATPHLLDGLRNEEIANREEN